MPYVESNRLGAVAAPKIYIAPPWLFAAKKVVTTQPKLAPTPSINIVTTRPVIRYAPPVVSDPGNNIAPTSTNLPVLAPAPKSAGAWWQTQQTQGAGSGPGMIPGAPAVEVGTLPAPGGSSLLAGLTESPLLLGGIALAAFMILGDSSSKPKRRRR